MDNTRRLGRLGALADTPLPDLVGTACEERAEVESLPHLDNDLGESRLDTELLALLGGLLVGHAGETLLEADGERNDDIAGGVGINPLLDLAEVLVGLADVVALRQVDEEDNGLRGEQHELVDNLDLRIEC